MASKASTHDTEIVIMAGGQGTRFWPISRKTKPKQFLSITKDGESLIQATARRIKPIVQLDSLHVITNSLHSSLVKEHIPEANIILEPCAKNTAAAIGLAAVYLKLRKTADAIMLVLPADHAVKDEQGLCNVLDQAIVAASKSDALVTIGIKPSCAHTGYGYIRRGLAVSSNSYKVARFYEKPSYERALKYLESEEYYWNAGMFAWKVSSILEAIAVYMPSLAKALATIEKAIDTPCEQQVIADEFAQLEPISIDFGVLEHATNCQVVFANDIGWSDVGSWDAWSEHFQKDQNGNMVKGEALLLDSTNCVVYSHKSQIAVLGAKDLIVIDAGDALLVCPREHVQDVKKIVSELQKQKREDLV